jgi:thiamine biosynthesis lipoprotein
MKIIQKNYYALGSKIIITIKFPRSLKSKEEIFQIIWKKIDNFEKKFSRFLSDSELTKVNMHVGKKIKVSDEFQDLVQKSIKMAKETYNLFNPFILPALQKSGYIGSWPNVKNNNGLNFSDKKICSINNIKINNNQILIPKYCALDFGGIGKGYLLDKIAKIILAKNIKDFWLSFGGDIICSGNGKNQNGWEIGISSAKDKKLQIDSIKNNGKLISIATSGIIKRKGIKSGKSWHHIINPNSGLPVKSDILTATVVGKKAILVDVFAKVIVILGLKKAKKFIKNKKIKMAIIQTKNKSIIKIFRK